MRPDRVFATLCFAPLLVACKTAAVQAEVPALLVSPGSEVRQELQLAVSKTLHGAPIVLANDAFARSSLLIVEQRPVKTMDQQAATGRMLGAPEHFRLFRSAGVCVLLHVRSATRTVLRDAECKAEEPAAVNDASQP